MSAISRLASEFVGLLPDSRCMTLKPCYKLLAALSQRHQAVHPLCEPQWTGPCMFRGKTGMDKILTDATKRSFIIRTEVVLVVTFTFDGIQG